MTDNTLSFQNTPSIVLRYECKFLCLVKLCQPVKLVKHAITKAYFDLTVEL